VPAANLDLSKKSASLSSLRAGTFSIEKNNWVSELENINNSWLLKNEAVTSFSSKHGQYPLNQLSSSKQLTGIGLTIYK